MYVFDSLLPPPIANEGLGVFGGETDTVLHTFDD